MEPKKIIIVVLIIGFLVAIFGSNTAEVDEALEQSTETAEECTARPLCIDQDTRATRNTDCSLSNEEICDYGCEAGSCRVEPVETNIIESVEVDTSSTVASTQGSIPATTKEECALGMACLDAYRKGYRTSNCVFNNVDACPYGCVDGKCRRASKVDSSFPEKSIATSGMAKFDLLAWRFVDFSDGEILIKDNLDYDAKMRFFPESSGYNYFPFEGFSGNVWVMDIPITDITFKDCDQGESKAISYSNLGPDQTLCIMTREDRMGVIGGSWEGLPGRDTILTWKLFEE